MSKASRARKAAKHELPVEPQDPETIPDPAEDEPVAETDAGE